eukprot:gene19441-biopygen20255
MRDELQQIAADLARRQAAQRGADFREWARDSWANEQGKIFAWCREEQKGRGATMLRQADGTFSGNVDEMDQALHRAWDPIFRMYADKDEPDWGPFAERFGKYIREHPMECADLTGADLRAVLGRMGGRQAGGMEGWRVRELKALPEPLLDRLARVFNTVERTGAWPPALQRALITLIPKGQGGEPEQMRPISVMSAIYRLWAAARLRDVMQWQERWAAPGQRGYRAGMGADDVFYELALRCEVALLTGTDFVGVTYDYAKCFDRIPQQIALKLLEALGMAARILKPLRAMYAGLRRRFRVGGGLGEEFLATNGILQGCPLSGAVLNALVSVWARAVEAEAEGARAAAYADDTYVTAEADAPVAKGNAVTEEFAALTGQIIHAHKSDGFRAAGKGRRGNPPPLTVGGAPLRWKNYIKSLGAPLHMTKGVRRPRGPLEERIAKATRFAQRVERVPMPFDARERIAAAGALPKGMWGCAVHTPSEAAQRHFRS